MPLTSAAVAGRLVQGRRVGIVPVTAIVGLKPVLDLTKHATLNDPQQFRVAKCKHLVIEIAGQRADKIGVTVSIVAFQIARYIVLRVPAGRA